jgi:hypothetical protein
VLHHSIISPGLPSAQNASLHFGSAASSYLELLDIGEEKVNRNKTKIKNPRKHKQTNDISKINRNKNAASASLNLRLPFPESGQKCISRGFHHSPIATQHSAFDASSIPSREPLLP